MVQLQGHGAPLNASGRLPSRLTPVSDPASRRRTLRAARIAMSGRSSGVEHNLAKVGVEGSNPFARSRFQVRATNPRVFVALRPDGLCAWFESLRPLQTFNCPYRTHG